MWLERDLVNLSENEVGESKAILDLSALSRLTRLTMAQYDCTKERRLQFSGAEAILVESASAEQRRNEQRTRSISTTPPTKFNSELC